jgi:hypothetical protein
MRQIVLFFLALGCFGTALVPSVHAQTIATLVAGKILLDVENHGEAWYVSPITLDRYYLQDGSAAFAALENFGLGITNADLAQIPVGSLYTDHAVSTSPLANRLSGRILLQVEAHGEAWYVHPANNHRYYLKDGEAAFAIMRSLSLGITSANLAQVPINAQSPIPPGGNDPSYQAYTLTLDDGSFFIKVATLPRADFEMITDTAATGDCGDDCPVQSLESFVNEHAAFAAIHGTYFCPSDYADCTNKSSTFLPPVFNTGLDVMINDDTLVFHDRPIIAQTTDGTMHFFRRSKDFGDDLDDYEDRSGLEVQAAIGNWPALIEAGEIVVDEEPTEASFTTYGTRGGLGWDENNFYLVIASGATVPNLASIFAQLGADYALNLDGGGSATLYYDGMYKAGPGRLLPNAVIFKQK